MNENSRGYKILEMAASMKMAKEKQCKYTVGTGPGFIKRQRVDDRRSIKFMPWQRRNSRLHDLSTCIRTLWRWRDSVGTPAYGDGRLDNDSPIDARQNLGHCICISVLPWRIGIFYLDLSPCSSKLHMHCTLATFLYTLDSRIQAVTTSVCVSKCAKTRQIS